MMKPATPLPYRCEGPDQFGDWNILHPEDSLAVGAVVSNLRHADDVARNAAYIVHACNTFPALVEALEELTQLMEDVWLGDYSPDSFTCQPAREALALAKGEAA